MMLFSASFLTAIVYGAIALAAAGAVMLVTLIVRDASQDRLW